MKDYDQAAVHISCVRLCATPQTTAHQAPLFMGFSRQEYWSGLPFPFPEDLPNPCIEPRQMFYPLLQTPSPLQETGLRRGLGVYREPLWEGLAREATGREGEEGALGGLDM